MKNPPVLGFQEVTRTAEFADRPVDVVGAFQDDQQTQPHEQLPGIHEQGVCCQRRTLKTNRNTSVLCNRKCSILYD